MAQLSSTTVEGNLSVKYLLNVIEQLQINNGLILDVTDNSFTYKGKNVITDAGGITEVVPISVQNAVQLKNPRTINGVNFDGTANILINTNNTLTRGSFLTGSNFNGGSNTTWAVDATANNVASKVVARDSSGNFNAGTITANLNGNSLTASSWQTARTISFTGDATGSASIKGDSNISIALTHRDTSNQGSVTTTAPTMIQNVTLDGFGHVTGLTTYNLDNRYYTETEVNTLLAQKPIKTTQIIAGAGLTGGGTLEANRTLNVVSANNGITVNADNILLNLINAYNNTSTTQAPTAGALKSAYDNLNANKITNTPSSLTTGFVADGINFAIGRTNEMLVGVGSNSDRQLFINYRESPGHTLPTVFRFHVGQSQFADIKAKEFYANGSQRVYHTGNKPTSTDVGLGNVPNIVHSVNPTVNTVAVRDGEGDLKVRLIESNFPNENYISGAIAFRKDTNDNYIRFCNNVGAIRTFLTINNVNNWGASSDINANSTSQYATTNLTKQLHNLINTKPSADNGYMTNLTINKIGNISTINFPVGSGGNDPAYIKHIETTSNVGIMEFSASDDRTSGDYFSFGSTPGGTYSECARLTTAGDFTAVKVFNAVWNDYAEYFPKEKNYITDAGDIIALANNSEKEIYELATSKHTTIIGVHSNEYGHLIGGENPPQNTKISFEEYNKKKYIPVGLVGRVHVKFKGKAKKGMAIVPSNIPGVGRKYNPLIDSARKIIGYCVENNNETGIRKIRMKIGK